MEQNTLYSPRLHRFVIFHPVCVAGLSIRSIPRETTKRRPAGRSRFRFSLAIHARFRAREIHSLLASTGGRTSVGLAWGFARALRIARNDTTGTGEDLSRYRVRHAWLTYTRVWPMMSRRPCLLSNRRRTSIVEFDESEEVSRAGTAETGEIEKYSL